MPNREFQTKFEPLLPTLRNKILQTFGTAAVTAGYKTQWEDFETIIIPVVIDFISSNLKIPRTNFKEATSKSTYPDLKITYKGQSFAIDIKSGEDTKPWWDVGRLDTYVENHFSKYTEEYTIAVRWKGQGSSFQVIDTYISHTHETIGRHAQSQGVLFRPYDGKLRPKSWGDFQNNTVYWPTKAAFLKGLEISKIHRHKYYIAEWYAAMSTQDRIDVKRAIKNIDAGIASGIEANE